MNHQWRSLWSLDPTVTFLNHGSFGACPIAVLNRQQSWRARLEAEPVRFFVNEYEAALDEARFHLAEFVGADREDLVFIANATTGVNTVLRSLRFQPGDELLVTNHEYNASRNALNVVAEQTGATIVVADIPFPIQSVQEAIDPVLAAVTARTRLLLIDHITSQTGLIMPIAELAQTLAEQGIDTLIDGAHAPGAIPLDLRSLGATFYTGNLHKWVCAPKGAGFLYVQRDRQSMIRPLVISHGANSPRRDRSRFRLEFDWTGTPDPTAYLCVPDAIRFMESRLPGGWAALMRMNHQLVLAARDRLCEALEISAPAPAHMLGSMASLHLPPGDTESLQQELSDHGIQVPIIPWQNGDRLLRISAQIYNRLDEYEYLSTTLVKALRQPHPNRKTIASD